MKKYLLALLLAPALLSGCESAKKPSSAPATATSTDSEKEGIRNKHWQLAELQGQPVTPGAGQERAAYFMLTDSSRVVGYGGCNSLNGAYELNEPQQRLRFTNMLSTLRACPGPDTERGFLQVLNQADNYTVQGDTLRLNVGRRAPLAVFYAVY